MKAFRLESFVKANPPLHDLIQRHRRRFAEEHDPIYALLDRFSQAHGGHVRFIMVGAGDGLHHDPLREFVLRDDWRGVFVEPEPSSFRALMRHYPARRFRNIRLVSAAISAGEDEGLLLFTVKPEALAALPPERQAEIRALASLDHDRLMSGLAAQALSPDVITAIEVPPATIEQLARAFFQDRQFDLLILDAGGHEARILGSLDLDRVHPDGFLIRPEGLGDQRAHVTQRLVRQGYAVRPIGDFLYASLV